MDITKLKRIKLLLLDVDGVLTDGSITYDERGKEIKSFNVKDGLGIRMLLNSGINVGIVTGRSSKAVYHRCHNLGISLVFDGVRDKASALDMILRRTQLLAQEVAFAGDDLLDLPILKRVGLSIAVADAHEIVRNNVDMITLAKGGDGAVREICEHILKAQGLWEDILMRFI
ncbi:MAG: HAD-IIIA family hydrolase [Deltaproteobacteria bacterium]|nr:HAD-IIIA family hydrolase [Deltaproteobacteria bacterium]